MAKLTQQEYRVGFVVRQWLEITVRASSLEEALKTASSYTIDDVLDSESECNDSSIKLVQVCDGTFEI